MEFRVEELRQRVYELLDENADIVEERVEYGDPGASVGMLIESFIPAAAKAAVKASPLSEIDECVRIVPAGSPDRRAGHMAVLELPEDFFRLVYFRMEDWEEGVTEALEYGSLSCQLRRRQGPYGYRMASPGVALRRRGGRYLLMIYGSGPESKAAELEYVAEPKLREGKIDFPAGLKEDVCERVAEMVSRVMGIQR